MKPFLLTVLALLATSLSAKDMVRTPADDLPVGELEPFLEEHYLKSKDDEATLEKLQGNKEFEKLVAKHGLRIFSGPVPGRLHPEGGTIWLRTSSPAKVQIEVLEKEGGKVIAKSPEVAAKAERDFAVELAVEGLEAGKSYPYRILLDGKVTPLPGKLSPVLRTAPAKDSKTAFSVAFGGGARYIAHREFIWQTVADQNALAFLWLGDNVYIDDPKSRSRQRLYYYRRQLRPEYRAMGAAGVAAYSIWDDHDFGANDSEGGPVVEKPEWRRPVWNVFRENWVNPAYGGGEELPGCWYSFSLGDVDFFMTDNRSYRHFKKVPKEERDMLGPVQKKWLLEELGKSKATFKVISSGTLWTRHADKGGADSWWGAPHERDEIFDFIADQKIGGVLLISADRHRTDIYEMKWKGDYPLYEFETSKLTNDHTHGTKKEALFSYNEGNFFGQLHFDFSKEDPLFGFECRSNEGKLIHRMEVLRSKLGPVTK